MSNNNYFGEGILFTISDYLIYFFIASIYFWMLNIPFLIYFIFHSINGGGYSAFILFIVLIPIFPALSALFNVMGKLIRENKINITRDFFSSYKTNFLEAVKLGIVQSGTIVLLCVYKRYINSMNNMYFFYYLITCILYICLAINVYIFSILSRFYMKKIDIYKLSIYYFIKKPYIGILSLIMIYIFLRITYSISFIISLIMISVFCYLLMIFMNNILINLESRVNRF